MKPHMDLVEISIYSQYHVILSHNHEQPLIKHLKIQFFKVFFYGFFRESLY